MKIAHISTHLGGGVGSVLNSFFLFSKDLSIENHLFCLDFCKSNFINLESHIKKREGIFFDKEFNENIKNELNFYDTILIHYWNHPLMAKFIADTNLPSEKVIFWIHNSGLFEPHIIPEFLLKISRKILFTSACSFEAVNLQNILTERPFHFGVVHSTRILDDFLKIGSNRESRLQRKKLLYVGTVSGTKMHLKSDEIFAILSKLGFSIRIVGGPDHELLKTRVAALGGQIETFGELEDILPFFNDSDIFVYPLKPEHYGTGEQVILEAMASGLPVVAFSNPAEKVILEGGGGLLVDSIEEFIKSVRDLSTSNILYNSISKLCITRASKDFDANLMVSKLKSEFNLPTPILHNDTSQDFFATKKGLSDLEIYVLFSFFKGFDIVQNKHTSQATMKNIIFEKIKSDLISEDSAMRWLGSSKGTPLHYSDVFPESEDYRVLSDAIINYHKHKN
jgi:glycosyltransferase involved in cell wall biosynthesis